MTALRPLALAFGIAASLAFLTNCAAAPGFSATARQGAFAAREAGLDDAVQRAIFQGETPRTVSATRARLLGLGGKLKTHVVANRGHDNPEAGSFSFFETYAGPMNAGVVKDGELFVGFFSERVGNTLAVSQSFEPGLMIEVIAWDYSKRLYNFYELVGTGKSAEWHYRGDSNDVLADVATINTGAPSPAFGTRLRCSGCHTLGGPILKELDAPHNDWWTPAERLDLGSMALSADTEATAMAASLFKQAVDVEDLAGQVRGGISRLVSERAARGGDRQSLKQQLRSLFAPLEMNLVSDPATFGSKPVVTLPEAFFVDARLSGGSGGVPVSLAAYREALAQVGSRFAPDEANREESHHAFVVPAPSAIDRMTVEALEKRGLLDAELVADVLAVDAAQPVYSKARASLLKFLPETATDAASLKAGLVANLKAAKRDAAAEALLANLTDPARTAAFHRARAQALVAAARKAAGDPKAVVGWLTLASQRRAEVAAAETSKNPRGRILEPGFRVIFPVDRLHAKPGALALDPVTARVVQAN